MANGRRQHHEAAAAQTLLSLWPVVAPAAAVAVYAIVDAVRTGTRRSGERQED